MWFALGRCMQITHLPIAGAFLATLALIGFVLEGRTHLGSIGSFMFPAASYGMGWVCTFIVLLVLVNRGGFDWFPGGAGLRYLVVSALHVAAGAICYVVIVEISDSRGDRWIWPYFALATLAPVLIQVGALARPGLRRFPLMAVIGMECLAAVTLPVAMANRAAEQKVAAFRRASAEIAALSPNAPIAEYVYFIEVNHQPGISELAARTMAARADHTEVMVDALHGPGRVTALRLLGIKGIPATPALAAAVADAIVIATYEAQSRREARDYENQTDIEALVVGDVVEQFGAYSAQLIPVLEKFVEAAGDSPGRRHIQEWLVRAKGTR
jgi:hypothetical protein